MLRHGCNTVFKEKLPIEIRFLSYENLENWEAGKNPTYSYQMAVRVELRLAVELLGILQRLFHSNPPWRPRLKHLRSLTLAALLPFTSIFALSQVDSGQLSGTVTDATGAVLPNAQVHLHNDANGFDRTQTTNDSGIYTFGSLPIGTYKETVTYQGFGTFTTQVTVYVGSKATTDAKLGAANKASRD